jgi:acylphosphatase
MRLHVLATGRVQGVGFRWFVRETARRLGLAGWVLNRADGSVEVAAEGDDSALLHLRNALADGPSGAHVESLVDLPALEDDLPRPFAVRRVAEG